MTPEMAKLMKSRATFDTKHELSEPETIQGTEWTFVVRRCSCGSLVETVRRAKLEIKK